ncbi:MAG: amidase family protein [Actinomycetota bacterium]|nr:amidase family protein [Actinomycetota bacterium]
MKDEEIQWMSACELIEEYRSRNLSPVEVTETIIRLTETINPAVNAIVTTTFELALEQAKKSERAYLSGSPGPLEGIPITIKDLIVTKGIKTTCGSKLFENYVPEEDAVLVERVRDAGSVILGKTNVPEFGLVAVTDNVVFGPTLNPWDLKKTAGGSSGGAAAAVSCGLGPIAVGNDGGGSIRIPTSLCGVFGLKPQFGRVPSYPHVVRGWETMNHEGPISRTVPDAALLLDVMAGPDDKDRFSLPDADLSYLETLCNDVKGLRMAYTSCLSVDAVDGEVAKITGEAAKVFEELGALVVEDDPRIPKMDADLTIMVTTEALVAHENRLDEAREKMFPLYRPFLEVGEIFKAQDIVRTNFKREELWDRIRRFFERYDILLTPTTACPAFDLKEGGMLGPDEIDGKPVSPASWVGFTFPFNFTGQPAASVPCGFTSDGLPVGIQIVGRRYDEQTVLRAAHAFETARPWRHQHPPASTVS